jgi:hypothetical protein
MNRRRYLVAVLTLAAGGAVAWAAYYTKTEVFTELGDFLQGVHIVEARHEVLKDLGPVLVAVGDLPKEAMQRGLKRETVRTDVELQLRTHGIEVITEKEWEEERGPALYVDVTCGFLRTAPVVVVHTQVALTESVLAFRNKTICTAWTWRRGSLSWGSAKDFPQSARGYVEDAVAAFIRDYLAANPKQREQPNQNGTRKSKGE